MCDVLHNAWHRLHDSFYMGALRMLPSTNLQPFSDSVFSAILNIMCCYAYLSNSGEIPAREGGLCSENPHTNVQRQGSPSKCTHSYTRWGNSFCSSCQHET